VKLRADSPEEALQDENVKEAIARGIIQVSKGKVIYELKQKKEYDWDDPEEWVRARTIAFLVVEKGYPAARMRTEVQVPRRTPSDWADIIVYEDDRCHTPYLVVENKAAGQSKANRDQGIEQGFGNANSLRASFVLYDEHIFSRLWDVANHPSMEREANRLGPRAAVPEQYGRAPDYLYIAAGPRDVAPVSSSQLEAKIRRAHSIIWAGGRRDPLTAFDEWSKLLFAKVFDERHTPTGNARQFQVGTNETTAAVANRIHRLFTQGCRDDFTQGCRDDPNIFLAHALICWTKKFLTLYRQSRMSVLFEPTLIASGVPSRTFLARYLEES
jgi:type I restriction enzyme M protein